ncbi:protoporphyrinogen oxidase [Alicyclobacillaceae bacterium I2511]|nr:protoporphyrinogen oxidase [Alicyclobacillaceae bacterium I2511]
MSARNTDSNTASELCVVIIGGGITGLSAAMRLHRALGQRTSPRLHCTVIEQDAQLGGKIKTYRDNGLVMEAGPDSLLARKTAGIDLVRSLGLEGDLVDSNPRARKTYIVHKGHLESMPLGTNMGVPAFFGSMWKTKLISPLGKARALLDMFIPKSGIEGDQSLGVFLRRRLGNEVVDQLIEPLAAGIYAARIDDLSLQATYPVFADLERKQGSLMRGSRQLLDAAAPMSGASAKKSGRSAFLTLRTGLQALIERLYDELHEWAELRTQTKVTEVVRDAQGGYAVAIEGPGNPEVLHADAVIVTVPAFVASELLSGLSAKAANLCAIRYASTATVFLGYEPGTVNVDLDASGFLVPRSEHMGITASTWVSSKWPHTAKDGRVLIRCYVGRSGQQESLQLENDAITAMVQDELRKVLNISAQPWFVKITRWPQSMPNYPVGHTDLVSDVELALQNEAPGVFIAGAGYHGLGIPDCIANANGAAEKVLQHLHLNADS